MKNYLKKNVRYIIIFALASAALFGAGFGTGRFTDQPNVIRPQVLRESGYKYINPVLLCNINSNQKINRDDTVQKKISAYIDKASDVDISAYYLNLNSGKWAGVNENEQFSPASMLKVPSMIAVLKYAEAHPEILSKKIFYDGSFDDDRFENIKPKEFIKPGHYYTVDQLINYTIVDSDNNALLLLHNNIDPESLEAIYIAFGITLPTENTDFMSAKTFSLFLRVLYNSTYLSREMSERALKLMIAADFSQGLVNGVPSNIDIADKFGEREFVSPADYKIVTARELHDCGIIYAQNNPYILCVMTRGMDFNLLASHVSNISKIVYDYISGTSQ